MQLEAAFHAVKCGRHIRDVGQPFGIAECTVRLLLNIGCTKTSQLSRKAGVSKGKERSTVRLCLEINFWAPIELRHVAYDFAEAKYTWCLRRNGQNFGRVFLMLKYTDITQNTYVQS